MQLGSRLDIAETLEAVSELEAALVFLDTRARCTVGIEENSATEQGRAIDVAERLVDATVKGHAFRRRFGYRSSLYVLGGYAAGGRSLTPTGSVESSSGYG